MTLTLTRRGFIGASGATGLAATLPLSVLAKAAGAAPPGPNDGILLTIFLRGGNDSLNTFGPFGNNTYNDQRLGLAINPGSGLSAGNGLYFHPSLSYLHQRWQNGDVAAIPGIGEANNDRSHFSSTSTWMSGRMPGENQSTGWMGRWLDTKGSEVLGASVDGGSPKQIRGVSASVVGVSRSKGNLLPTGSREQAVNVALRRHNGGGLSPMGDAFGTALGDAARFSTDQLPLYAEGVERSDDRFTADLERAYRIDHLVIEACERAIARDAADEWVGPTLLGAAFRCADIEKADELADRVELDGAAQWKLESTISDLTDTVAATDDPAVRATLESTLARLRALV